MSTTERSFASRRIERAGTGIAGGLVATAVMTAYRASISASLPPTAEFWAKYVGGGDPDDHPVAALLLHLAYGAAAGLVYAVAVPLPDDEYHAERRGTAIGVAYGLALSAFGERALIERLLGMELSPDERLVFHLGHVVYGLTLGTWTGSRARD